MQEVVGTCVHSFHPHHVYRVLGRKQFLEIGKSGEYSQICRWGAKAIDQRLPTKLHRLSDLRFINHVFKHVNCDMRFRDLKLKSKSYTKWDIRIPWEGTGKKTHAVEWY